MSNSKKNFNIGISIYINQNKVKNKSSIAWIYSMNKDTIHKDINGDFYFLDLEKVKLYIWNHECNAYACVGIQRILAIREQLNHNESQDIGIKIFIKVLNG